MEDVNKRPIVGVGVMVLKGNKVLVGRRKGSHGEGQYAWPGGHLEYMESFEECAKREVREEANIEICNIRFLRLMNLRDYEPKHYVDVMLVADWLSGDPVVAENEKIIDWDWYELNDLPGPFFATLPTAIEAYKTGRAFYDAGDSVSTEGVMQATALRQCSGASARASQRAFIGDEAFWRRYRDTQLEMDARVLFEALDDCELQKIGLTHYNFLWNSLSEQTPPTPLYLRDAAARLLCYVGRQELSHATLLSSEEDRGAILAAAVQRQVDLPLCLSRWVSQPREGRPKIPLKMEFAEGVWLHLDGMQSYDAPQRVVVVDDIISTGGTMISQCRAIIELTPHELLGVIVVADKSYGGVKRLQDEIGIAPKLVASVDCAGQRSKVTGFCLEGGEDLVMDIRSDIEKNGRRYFDNRKQELIARSL